MSALCAVCTVPSPDSQLCTGCYERTTWRLQDLHLLVLELHTAMQRMVRMTERNEGGHSFERALVFNDKAAETIRLIRSTLVAWVRELAKDTGTPLPRNNQTQALTEFLVHTMPEFRVRADAGAFAEEVEHLTKKSTEVIDLPVNRTVIPVGPCPEDIEGKPCPGEVSAIIPNNEEKRPVMRCQHCKTEWPAEQWHRTGTKILARKGERPRMNEEAAANLMNRIVG